MHLCDDVPLVHVDRKVCRKEGMRLALEVCRKEVASSPSLLQELGRYHRIGSAVPPPNDCIFNYPNISNSIVYILEVSLCVICSQYKRIGIKLE